MEALHFGEPLEMLTKTRRLKYSKCMRGTNGGFAAIKSNGAAVTWGYSLSDGIVTYNAVAASLTSVASISATYASFAAVKADGTVVT